jgi:hypothetical protein
MFLILFLQSDTRSRPHPEAKRSSLFGRTSGREPDMVKGFMIMVFVQDFSVIGQPSEESIQACQDALIRRHRRFGVRSATLKIIRSSPSLDGS